jgi:hypothetical protein
MNRPDEAHGLNRIHRSHQRVQHQHSLVLSYMNLHGKVVSGKVIYDVERSGPLKGLETVIGNTKWILV